MGRPFATVILVSAGLAVAGGTALGGYGSGGASAPPVAAEVKADGNPLTNASRLGFFPQKVRVKVGEEVRWTNADSAAPHTATEDHGLWNLSGDYGPPGSMGFGPGESVKRAFEAGSHSYFCEVHPDTMRGVVDVPVTLSRTRGGDIKARWGASALPADQAFDVQRRKGGRPWATVRKGTRKLNGRFGGGRRGTTWRFRARLRKAGDPDAATGYSPPAKIKSG